MLTHFIEPQYQRRHGRSRCHPDEILLKQIFTTNQPWTISIFLQTWDKCVFKAEFPEGLEDRHSTCVVRLEADNQDLKSFTTIAAMQ